MSYDEKLKAAREAGKASAVRRGSIRADVAEIMARGADHPVEILRDVLERRGLCPIWLSNAVDEELDQIADAMATWITVRAAIKQLKAEAPSAASKEHSED